MAAVTGSFKTYDAVGNREDLTDVIYNISPADTPFMSAVGKGKAKAVLHEWQTDSLAAVNTGNAVVEANTVTGSTSAPTTRAQNYCQISEKDVVVSGTQEAVDKAGRKDEMAYQMAKRSKELKRDMEAIVTGPQGQVAGDQSTPRKTRALESWLQTNDNRATNGAQATAATAAPTDGTQRAFTETILKDVIQKCYASGGNPSLIMVGPVNKQKVSDFTGRASARQNVSAKTIMAAASLYASDFGDLRVVPNRFQRERSAFVLDPEYAKISYLRPFKRTPLAKTGDAERAMLNVEWCLEMSNEAAHGVAADLTTS
ncbi:DUF5309 domain-containing protein [Azospirillum sp. ST 5-10]|uniref:DUF5309 domain-containing protein n=1 Tax=unclassified Azospirillum TaxID=2630922 RepID=UPI003F4A4E99